MGEKSGGGGRETKDKRSRTLINTRKRGRKEGKNKGGKTTEGKKTGREDDSTNLAFSYPTPRPTPTKQARATPIPPIKPKVLKTYSFTICSSTFQPWLVAETYEHQRKRMSAKSTLRFAFPAPSQDLNQKHSKS